MKDCFVFDMDGTLCDVRDIRHLILGETRNFHAFHSESVNCSANADVVQDMWDAQAQGIPCVIVTARSAEFMNITVWWCLLNGITYDQMYFRQKGDYRPDREVKEDIVKLMKKDGFNPIKAWDDNPNIIAMWKDMGIECVEVEGYLYA